MEKIRYEIMHGTKKVAWIDTRGHCKILYKTFMPYQLYLDDKEDDVDTLVNNITNFYYWCASRVLTLDRQYAKEILNSIGVIQAATDRDRAQIALSYHCLSLTDIYWVRKFREHTVYDEINLYDNHLDNAFVDVSLRGRQMTVQNKSLVRDLSTDGCFPKAWIRREGEFFLLKGGADEAVDNEVLASQICQCFRCRQVAYQEESYDGQKVSVSRIMTNRQFSIVSREAFEIYACNKEIDPMEYILKLDGYSYYMMNILDYLVGNTDRHWGNWGLLVDNNNNKPVSLHPLMDLNQAFHSYEDLEGANCQTVFPEIMTQRQAAIEAVRKVGLNQMGEIEKEWFKGNETRFEMFNRRLELLKS